MNIIIIDDDPLVVESLKIIINANEIDILAVGYDGFQAVEYYAKYKPDLILMHIRMEKMSGIDAAKEILKMDPKAKILLITTFQDDEYIATALALIRTISLKPTLSPLSHIYPPNPQRILGIAQTSDKAKTKPMT